MKLYYISDIHLEHRKEIPIILPEDNSYLALCGDIGFPSDSNYKEFLDIHSKLFLHIFLITGNHEYYGKMGINNINELIQSIVDKYNNITFLNQSYVIIDNIKFIGCTLWSDVSQIEDIEDRNDYRYVFNRGQIITPKDITELHFNMKEFLRQEIENSNYKTIILTHHAPTFGMLAQMDKFSGCYASNCDDLIKYPVSHWISGHTHSCKEFIIDNILCVSNCMGYPTQDIKNFSLLKYVNINIV